MAELLSADLFDQDKLEEQQEDGHEGESASLKHLCSEMYARISSFLQIDASLLEDQNNGGLVRQAQQQTQRSLDIIREALDRYSIEELSLSYNGGKDCLVLLILYLAALSTHPRFSSSASSFPTALQAVYIIPQHPFDEIDTFVTQTSQAYHLDLARYSAPMRTAFEAYLRDDPHHDPRQRRRRRRSEEGVKAVLVGTRRTDPNGAGLSAFDRTDGKWPDFMRVHPVIDWRYGEVWTFLRYLKIPYCPLYDRGYTSLGGTTDTHPNPALLVSSNADGEGEKGKRYRPAYELQDDNKERLGRDVDSW